MLVALILPVPRPSVELYVAPEVMAV